MIGHSQAIVVASIESLPKTPRTHSGNSNAVQSVRVLYVLKGKFTPQEQIDVALDSEILYPARTNLRLDDFPLGERYVLFIAVDSLSSHGYSIVNAQGSAFWIPRESDLSALKPGDVRENIALLLNDVLNYSKPNDEAFMTCVQDYLSEDSERRGFRLTSSCSGP